MAVETNVAVQRPKGTPVPSLQYEPVRIVEKTIMVVSGDGGAVPYNLINLFSRRGIPDIRTGDFVTDLTTNATYRASGIPITHDSSYLKIQLTRYVEVTP